MHDKGLGWRRASHCDSAACVEVAFDGDSVLIRDSKDPAGPALTFTRNEWRTFVSSVSRPSGAPLELH
jgi:hypothetical protein